MGKDGVGVELSEVWVPLGRLGWESQGPKGLSASSCRRLGLGVLPSGVKGSLRCHDQTFPYSVFELHKQKNL